MVHRVVALALAAALDLGAQPATPDTAPAVVVTRADLARTYTRLDGLLATRTLAAGPQRRINEAFDRGTLAFFLGQGAATLAQLDSIAAALDPSLSRRLMAWRVAPEPARLLRGSRSSVRIQLARLYADSTTHPLSAEAKVIVRDGAGRERARLAPPIGEDSTVLHATAPAGLLAALPEGRYTVWLRDGRDSVRGEDLIVVVTSLDSARVTLRRRLDALELPVTLTAARSALRSRLTLLTMRPDANNTAQLLADPLALSAEVHAELDALARGVDPYAGRVGDWWQTMTVGSAAVPMRIVVPPRPADTTRRRGLVIALHGAGMDENAFPDGYGAGRIVALAADANAVVVSPATARFSAAAFDSVVRVMVRDHGVDPGRVVLIGHSAGAAQALSLAAQRATQIRAVAAIAGAGAVPASAALPPTLVLGAALDPVIPAPRVRALAQALQRPGRTVEYRELANWGHTLVVGSALPSVFTWLWSEDRVPKARNAP